MVEATVRAAAEKLLQSRRRALEPAVTALASSYDRFTSTEMIEALKSAGKDDRPAVGFLIADRMLREACQTDSVRLLGSFLFRLSKHLTASISSPRHSYGERAALAIAADEILKRLPTASSKQLADSGEVRARVARTAPEDVHWRRALGLARAEFDALLETVTRGLATPPPKEPGPERPAPMAQPAAAASGRLPRWVALPAAVPAGRLVEATRNWTPVTDGQPAGDPSHADLEAAWTAFEQGRFADTAGLLSGVCGSVGRSWGASSSADGLRFWHWLKLVVELGRLETGQSVDQRRASISAFELALRCLGQEHPLVERTRVDALRDLAATDRTSSRALMAYTLRAVAAVGHEAALAEFDGAERAMLRGVWRDWHEVSDDEARNTALLTEVLAGRLRTATQRLHVAARDEVRNQMRALRTSARELAPFLDEAEAAYCEDVVELALETSRVLDSEAASLPELVETESALLRMLNTLAQTSSLILQDFLAPCLERYLEAAQAQRQRMAGGSRPAISVRLDTTRLPLSAVSGTQFPIRVVVTNDGNAAAEAVEVTVHSEEIGITGSAELAAALAPGAEDAATIMVTSTGQAPQAAGLAVKATWRDALRQEFTNSTVLPVEDQRPATWSDADVNPFSLGTISDPARLVGRDDDLASLEALVAGGGSAYITGQKRVGKTSLVRVLLRRTQRSRGWAGEVLPLGRALGPDQSAADLVYALLDDVAEAISDASLAQGELPDVEPDPEGNFARAANRWLRRVARKLPPESRVVIAIDDFDELPQHLVSGPQADALFLFLRTLVDEPWLNLVVVGSEVLPSIIQAQAHKLNQVVPVSVTNFANRASTEALLVTPTRDRLEWHSSAIDRVHSMCRGNPYYETLLAHQLWQDLREQGRSFVTIADVDSALDSVARTAPASHFIHLWADSATGIDHTSRTAIVASAALRAVARCGGPALQPAHVPEVQSIAQQWIQTASGPELKNAITSLVNREVLVRTMPDESLNLAIPLVAHWMLNAGARALDSEYATSAHAVATARIITDTDLAALSRGLVYRGEHISEIRLNAWLKQFGDNYHQHLAFLLLRRMVKDGYFSTTRINDKVLPRLRDVVANLPAAHHIVRDHNGYMKNGYIIDHGVAGDSSQGAIAAMTKALKIKKAHVVAPSELQTKVQIGENGVVLFVLDDFAGSGTHLGKTVEEVIRAMSYLGDTLSEQVEIVVGAGIVADLDALPMTSSTGLTLHRAAANPLGARLQAFVPEAGIFESDKELEDARELMTNVGRSLLPNNPLGFGGGGWLVLLEFNCPNNVLPVFWRGGTYAGADWVPLFERSF